MTDKNLLQLRKKISARRPKFVPEDKQKRKRLSDSWRKPKGMHSKMRHGFWGKPACVRGPKAVRGLHFSGLVPVLVNTVAELEKIDSKIQGVIIGHIGGRKKIQVLEACKQKGITVLNVKNVDETTKMLTDKVTARKEAKKAREKKAKPVEKKPEAKKEEKKPEVEKTKEEERKDVEKILTKRE